MSALADWLKKGIYIPEGFGAIKPDFGKTVTDLAEETVVAPLWLREAMAATRGRPVVPDHELVPVPRDKVFPVTAARRKAQEEALENSQPGQLMPDGTIYLGQYKPKDRASKSLSMAFNVFAAREDLPELMNYDDTVKYISRLKNWHGFDGTHYANDTEIYAALKDGSYAGGWIIPTRDILCGKDVDDKETTPDNLYAHKDKFNVAGDPKRAFKTAAGSGSDYPHLYWSSTENRDHSSCVHTVRFSDGCEDWDLKDCGHLSCRPVRLVEASAPAPASR